MLPCSAWWSPFAFVLNHMRFSISGAFCNETLRKEGDRLRQE